MKALKEHCTELANRLDMRKKERHQKKTQKLLMLDKQEYGRTETNKKVRGEASLWERSVIQYQPC